MTLRDDARSRQMRLIRSNDTKPELVVRRKLHALGYRYRLHCVDLPGKPDIVFRSRKRVIFVHGCFWHRHRNCRKNRTPKSRIDYWAPKLARNAERDRSVRRKLARKGWKVLVIWECELKDIEAVTRKAQAFLSV